MPKSNIVLCGFMASGKTTVGRIVSSSTGMPLVDTDALVEAEAGRDARKIFEEEGEERFRQAERLVIAGESARDGVVLAVGGGAVLDGRNVAELKKRGVIYLLEVTPVEVANRVGVDAGRPLLPDDLSGIDSLMRERSTAYSEAADVVVNTTGRDPLEVAGEIVSDFESRRRDS